MEHIINPFILYGLIALGALGVGLALPRRGTSPQVIGAILAALAAGGVVVALTLQCTPNDRPAPFFYVFAAIGLAAALRVITHPRPVYAALWFIMTVLASAGLFLMLSAEFMAFAFIIVYAGAILITYLFVIMLATQAPVEGETEVLAGYDVSAREPIAATVVGFVMLGALTTMMFRGIPEVPPAQQSASEALIARLPRKIESDLRAAGLIQPDEGVATEKESGDALITMGEHGAVTVRKADGSTRLIARAQWPKDLGISNVQALGFNFLSEHPGSIEIAGVLLMMAMLGAVVLSRKQVQLDEEAKLAQARDLASRHVLTPSSTREGGGA